ncbi:MAG: TerB family tellurite resistance protein [Deltaproteobacteria bacterium]|nr:TerB family tellurite resistance protein [Deltaproteobacteria bacterium]
MGWFGKLAFGSLGMFLGGPLGAILGAALGHHMVDKKADVSTRTSRRIGGPTPDYLEQTQATYFISLFSILGKFSKIDGLVSRDEINIVQGFIDQLPITDQEKHFARQIFNEAKNSKYSIEDFAIQMYQAGKHEPGVLLSFLDLLFQIAAADGTLHPGEEAALKRIKEIFRISDQQYESTKALYFKDLDRYYRILNCTPQSTNEEIRSSYKKLVKDFHPDRILSKGLPEEFVDFATRRFHEIQEAYERIRKERGL